MSARLDVGCILLSALILCGAMQRSRAIVAIDPPEPMRPPGVVAGPPALPDTRSLDDAAATIVANDPFRLSNKPASVRFASAALDVTPIAHVRPQFVLRAIVGGPPWSAIVEGIPGQAGGIVVSAGLAFDMVRIRSITRDTVVVQTSDTTWKLTMRGTP